MEGRVPTLATERRRPALCDASLSGAPVPMTGGAIAARAIAAIASVLISGRAAPSCRTHWAGPAELWIPAKSVVL